jgi:hypothetical protein
MALDKATYYRQRVQQLRDDAAFQRKTLAELEQRLFMIEAELSAFESALQLATPQHESVNGPTQVPDQEQFSSIDSTGEDLQSAAVPSSEKSNTFFISDTGEMSVPLTELESRSRAKSGEPPSLAETLRSILAQNNSGMTPGDLLKAFSARSQTIKREYLYALLSRLRSRGELKRRGGKYSINEARERGYGKDFRG